MRIALTLVAALALASCSTTGQEKAAANTADAVATPLNDLNLVQAPIPDLLQQAAQHPYALPADRSCEALAAAVKQLDDVLGPDLDAPSADARGLLDRAGDEAGGAATGALKRTAEGVIPFRGWIRKLTGAERYSKRVAAAITAGGVRRGFLKGLRASQGCGG
jgi:hypothetical protein